VEVIAPKPDKEVQDTFRTCYQFTQSQEVEQPRWNAFASGSYLDDEWFGDLRTWNDSGDWLEAIGY
jgi:hypothetical protein